MVDLAFGALDALRACVSGVVALAGDDGFDEACSLWNGAITRRPAVVVRCATTDDVAAALSFADQHRLEVSVRGGGHNYAGFAIAADGLMIDLSLMKTISVDATNRRATCGGGATWAELDAATQEHGLAVPGGFVSHTGVGGLTLGGGFGWLSRRAGLSSDNLAGAQIVTADGTVHMASRSENPDLFWALRGGGGNFGVVTSFEFDLCEVGPFVHLGLFFYAPEQGGDMLRFGRGFVEGLPDECGVFMAGLNAPPEAFVPEQFHYQPFYALAVVGLGSAEHHARLIEPIRSGPSPVFEMVTPIPYAALQQMFDPAAPWGILAYEKAVYLDELTDAAIDVIVEHQPKKASPLSFLPIFVLGGAYARADENATAFGGRRSTKYVVNIAAHAPTPELYDTDRTWVRAFWSDLVAHAADTGSYVNFMTDHDENRIRSAYGASKYARLAEIKATYDPGNVFHLNVNIPPA